MKLPGYIKRLMQEVIYSIINDIACARGGKI